MGNFRVKNISGTAQYFALDGREFRLPIGGTATIEGKYRRHPVVKYLLSVGSLKISNVPSKPFRAAEKPVKAEVEKIPEIEDNHTPESVTEPQEHENGAVDADNHEAEEELAFQCCGTTQSGSRCRRKVVMTQAEYDAAGGEVFCPTHKE